MIVFDELCHGCGACVLACPEGFLKETEREIGTITHGDSNGLEFYSATLDVGEARVTPLISGVVEASTENEDGDRLVVIDAPPGTSCSAMAAVEVADLVLLVTEPTPAALHDLQRIIEVVGHFKTPLGIVINRADIHPETNTVIKQFASENGFDLLAEIPYDPCMPRALAEGKLALTVYPDAPSSRVIKELAYSVLGLF